MQQSSLNLIPSGDMPIIYASQYDNNRVIRFNLFDGEDEYTLSGTETVKCNIRKNDEHIVVIVPTIGANKYIDVYLTEQACACFGDNIGEITISNGEDNIIGTINFILKVERNPIQGGVTSATDIDDLTSQIEEIVQEVMTDDYYTKTEVDAKLDLKANASDVYTKSQVDTALGLKADKADTYTKSQVDTALASKADASSVYTKSEVDTALAAKANASDVYTKTEVDEMIDDLYPVNTASGSIATFSTSLALPLVACEAQINSPMGLKGLNYWYGRESSWSDVVQIVRSGNAPTLLPIGSQITDKWTNGANGTTYDFVWDIVNYGNYEKADGTTAFGMVLQAHYCEPVDMPFSGYPALLACPNGLSAGTYHFKISANWGNISGNTGYQFTLTQGVPNNGLVCAPNNWPDVAVANWKITTYASNTSATAIEQVALTAGNGGTDLGTFTPGYQSATMNGYQAAAYGYNRWSKSAIRQWLNSDAPADAWWHPQTVWDRVPSKADTERGFLAGFSDDFKHILHETKIKTALNTSDKTTEGVGFEYTYDKLFLPSLEEMYINPQATGDDAEGAYWEYYKELNGTGTKFAQYGTYPGLIKYNLANYSSAVYHRLRSAYRGYSNLAWGVSASGTVTNAHAFYARQCAPACIII